MSDDVLATVRAHLAAEFADGCSLTGSSAKFDQTLLSLRCLLHCTAATRQMRRVFTAGHFWQQLCLATNLETPTDTEAFRIFISAHLQVRSRHRRAESSTEALHKNGVWIFDRMPQGRKLIFMTLAGPATVAYLCTLEALRLARSSVRLVSAWSCSFLGWAARTAGEWLHLVLRHAASVVQAVVDAAHLRARQLLRLLRALYGQSVRPLLLSARQTGSAIWGQWVQPALDQLWRSATRARAAAQQVVAHIAEVSWRRVVRPALKWIIRISVICTLGWCVALTAMVPWNTVPVYLDLQAAFTSTSRVTDQLEQLVVMWPTQAVCNLPCEWLLITSCWLAPWRTLSSAKLLFSGAWQAAPRTCDSGANRRGHQQRRRALLSHAGANAMALAMLWVHNLVWIWEQMKRPLRAAVRHFVWPMVGAVSWVVGKLREVGARAVLCFWLPLVDAAQFCRVRVISVVAAVALAVYGSLIRPLVAFVEQVRALLEASRDTVVAWIISPIRLLVHEVSSMIHAIILMIRNWIQECRQERVVVLTNVKKAFGLR